jgi:hypothetical protein
MLEETCYFGQQGKSIGSKPIKLVSQRLVRVSHFAEEVARVSGLTEFALIGGAVFDTLTGYRDCPNEIDIAIQGNSPELVERVRNHCIAAGLTVEVEPMSYTVNQVELLTLMLAKDENRFYDFSFLETFTIGQFNLETLYFRYPENTIADDFDAIGGFTRREILPVRGLDMENPHLLAGRFLKLSTKYDIDPDGAELHREIVRRLSVKIRAWRSVPGGLAECNSAEMCLAAIWQATYPSKRFWSLHRLGLISAVFPEIPTADKVENTPKLLDCANVFITSRSFDEAAYKLLELDKGYEGLAKRIIDVKTWSWTEVFGGRANPRVSYE